MAGRLEGKVALITGGAKGQGAAEARLFSAEGASVVITDVADDEGEALARELGSGALYHHLNVASEDEWPGAIAAAVETFGGLDILVNNAGIVRIAPLLSMSLRDYIDVINVNQIGVFLGMRAAAPQIAKRGGGSIVNISSIDGMAGALACIGYVSSKWAVRGMTKTAAGELAPMNIRVNSVHPGGVDTEMLRPVPGVFLGEYFERAPLGRLATAEEIANLVLFLASDESSYCTGSEFVIDGGLLAIAGPQLSDLLGGSGD